MTTKNQPRRGQRAPRRRPTDRGRRLLRARTDARIPRRPNGDRRPTKRGRRVPARARVRRRRVRVRVRVRSRRQRGVPERRRLSASVAVAVRPARANAGGGSAQPVAFQPTPPPSGLPPVSEQGDGGGGGALARDPPRPLRWSAAKNRGDRGLAGSRACTVRAVGEGGGRRTFDPIHRIAMIRGRPLGRGASTSRRTSILVSRLERGRRRHTRRRASPRPRRRGPGSPIGVASSAGGVVFLRLGGASFSSGAQPAASPSFFDALAASSST